MTDFIPPYPERHKKFLNPIETLKHARQDLLSIWPEFAFERQFMAVKVLNRSFFIANHPEVVRYVLVDNQANYGKKSALLRKALAPLLGDALFISDGTIWQQRRDLQAPLFDSEQVAKHSGLMAKSVLELAQQWSVKPAGSVTHILLEMRLLSAEMLCRVLFGSSINKEQVCQIAEGFSQYQSAIEQIDISSFFGLPSWLPGMGASKSGKAVKAVQQLFDKAIEQSVNAQEQSCLLADLSARLQANAGSPMMTQEQIRNELLGLFMAGYETCPNILAWAWYLVSQCPEVEGRLHREIDELPVSESIGIEDLARLPYTQAILKETMRLYPAIPMMFREAATDDIIRKRHIPAGSLMLIVPWLLHRHQKYWEKPDHFIPERFLDAAPDAYTYIPFSGGPRECIAKNFGLVQMTLSFAILAKRFRLKLSDGQAVGHECRLTLRPKDNLPMLILPR